MSLPNTIGDLSINQRNKEVEMFLEEDMTKYEERVLKRVLKNMNVEDTNNLGSELLHELIRLSDIALKHFVSK